MRQSESQINGLDKRVRIYALPSAPVDGKAVATSKPLEYVVFSAGDWRGLGFVTAACDRRQA